VGQFSVRLIVAEPDHLGDCPTWNDSVQRLLWIDIIGKRMSSCAPDGTALARQPLPETPGSFALRAGGGMLMAFRRRLALFDPMGAEIASFVPDAADMNRERFNDGACDGKGRLWIGTMDRFLREPVGALYRVDPDLSTHRMDFGLGVSNGIAWSPRSDRLYHCDSKFPRIYAHDFDLEAGSITNRRIFVEFGDRMGVPDGCAVDIEGFLWVAAPGAGAIFGFDPRGRLAKKIETPVFWPSSVVFGGADLRTMFVTSLVPREESTVQGSRHQEPRDPHAGNGGGFGAAPPADGSVFAVECDVPGTQCWKFGG